MPNIDKIIAAINKGFKTQVAAPLSKGIRSDVKHVIPTGLSVVDNYVLGCGGLPAGRTVELFADEGVGKTSFMLSCLAGVQRAGGVAILAETEVAMEARRSQVFGVNWDEVILLEPGHLGELLQQAEAALAAVPKNTLTLFAWDSVAATMSKEEAEEGLSEKEGFDKRAKAISKGMRVLGPLAAEKTAAMLYVNQVRANIGGGLFGPKTTTPGGHAMKFHASARLCMYPGTAVKASNGQHVGKHLTIQAVKNKLAPPWRKAKLRLDFATGWDDRWATLNHAKELKIIGPRQSSEAALEQALEQLQKTAWTGVDASPVEDEFEE